MTAIAYPGFSWTDSVQTAYTTRLWIPNVDKPYQMRQSEVPLLSGGTFLITQATGAGAPVIPDEVTLTWEIHDPAFFTVAKATHAARRPVAVEYPWEGATASITGIVTDFKPVSIPGKLYSLSLTIKAVSV